MRVLLINYEYPPVGGGAGNATACIARALAELGHSPIVLTAAYGSEPAKILVDGVNVVRVRAWRTHPDRSSLLEMAGYVAAAAIALPRVLRTERPDAAIVFFSMPCGPLGLLARWRAGIPYLVSLRGGDVPGTESRLGLMYSLLAPARRLVMRKAAAVIANSSGLKSLSEAADPIKVEVIPNGVDADFYRPAAERGDRPFTFLFVGRFQQQKNLSFLLQAVAASRREPGIPFRLTIVGDGPARVDLQQQCTASGLDDIVTWHGWCSKEQLLLQYQAADCLVNPSLYEGMPNTVLEAMACGLAVLASNVPGNDAVVLPGETGLLFGLGDVSEFVGAMRSLLADAALTRNMGDAARRWVSRDFSWQSVARQYLGVLEETRATQ